MCKSFIAVLGCLCVYQFAFAQLEDGDFKCYDKGAYLNFDLMQATRSFGNYDPEEEWSQKVTSNTIVRKNIEMEGGRLYVILLAAEFGSEATAMEIRDGTGTVLEYVYKIVDPDKNEITFFYTPTQDDDYQISFRVINSHKPYTCAYMGILKGDIDPDFGGIKSEN